MKMDSSKVEVVGSWLGGGLGVPEGRPASQSQTRWTFNCLGTRKSIMKQQALFCRLYTISKYRYSHPDMMMDWCDTSEI